MTNIDHDLVLSSQCILIATFVGVCHCSMFCCTLLYVPSSFAIILMGKRELVALLSLSPWCLVIVVWLFLAVPWVCLQFVIVLFPDHTHLLFLTIYVTVNTYLISKGVSCVKRVLCRVSCYYCNMTLQMRHCLLAITFYQICGFEIQIENYI